jgi:hypothetical protein
MVSSQLDRFMEKREFIRGKQKGQEVSKIKASTTTVTKDHEGVQ